MAKPWPALRRTVPAYPPLHVSIARVIPTFFLIGAGIELFMQKVPIGGRTFYDVALDKEAERRYLRQKDEEEAAERAAARLKERGEPAPR